MTKVRINVTISPQAKRILSEEAKLHCTSESEALDKIILLNHGPITELLYKINDLHLAHKKRKEELERAS